MAELDPVALKVAIAQVALPGKTGERAGAVIRTQLALVEAALDAREELRRQVRVAKQTLADFAAIDRERMALQACVQRLEARWNPFARPRAYLALGGRGEELGYAPVVEFAQPVTAELRWPAEPRSRQL